jgi:hypothetical protein
MTKARTNPGSRTVYIASIVAMSLMGLLQSDAAAAPKKPAAKKASATIQATPPRHVTDLRVVSHAESFTTDYQADVYAGVPLSDPYARERGLEHGLVWMAFSNERQFAFRVPKEKMKSVVRMIVDDDARTPPGYALANKAFVPVTLSDLAGPPSPRAYPKDRVDVLSTADGTIVVLTSTANAGIFTSSDVYVFPPGTHEADVALVAKAPAYHREHLKDALVLAHDAK